MSKNTIVLKNYSKVREEIIAAGAITPGHLVEETSAGKAVVHNSAGENAIPMFAIEDELQGNTITDDYASGDPVQVWIPTRGDQVYALLANGESVAIGDFLESNGDGTLKAHAAGSAGVVEYPLAIVAVALEAVDMSDSSGADPSGRISVRIV